MADPYQALLSPPPPQGWNYKLPPVNPTEGSHLLTDLAPAYPETPEHRPSNTNEQARAIINLLARGGDAMVVDPLASAGRLMSGSTDPADLARAASMLGGPTGGLATRGVAAAAREAAPQALGRAAEALAPRSAVRGPNMPAIAGGLIGQLADPGDADAATRQELAAQAALDRRKLNDLRRTLQAAHPTMDLRNMTKEGLDALNQSDVDLAKLNQRRTNAAAQHPDMAGDIKNYTPEQLDALTRSDADLTALNQRRAPMAAQHPDMKDAIMNYTPEQLDALAAADLRTQQLQHQANMPFREKYPEVSSYLPFLGAAAAFGVPYISKFPEQAMSNALVNRWRTAVEAGQKARAKGGTVGGKTLQDIVDDLGGYERQYNSMHGLSSKVGNAILGAGADAEVSMIPNEYDAINLPPGNTSHDKAVELFSDPKALAERLTFPAAIGTSIGHIAGHAPGPWPVYRVPPVAETTGLRRSAYGGSGAPPPSIWEQAKQRLLDRYLPATPPALPPAATPLPAAPPVAASPPLPALPAPSAAPQPVPAAAPSKPPKKPAKAAASAAPPAPSAQPVQPLGYLKQRMAPGPENDADMAAIARVIRALQNPTP